MNEQVEIAIGGYEDEHPVNLGHVQNTNSIEYVNGGEIRQGDASKEDGGASISASVLQPSPTYTRDELVEIICRYMHKKSISYKPYHSDEFLLIYHKDACDALDALIAIGAVRVR